MNRRSDIQTSGYSHDTHYTNYGWIDRNQSCFNFFKNYSNNRQNDDDNVQLIPSGKINSHLVVCSTQWRTVHGCFVQTCHDSSCKTPLNKGWKSASRHVKVQPITCNHNQNPEMSYASKSSNSGMSYDCWLGQKEAPYQTQCSKNFNKFLMQFASIHHTVKE